MLHAEITLDFSGHALFYHSTVKAGSFNEIRSLDAPQVTTLYGAFLQCATMMQIDPSILDRVAITPPQPVSTITRNMLIFTAPMSPFDWQPKWVGLDGRYAPMRRVFPRRLYPLWRPRYRMHVFAEDKEAAEFVSNAIRLLSDRMNGRVGANLRIGYKKKLFGSFNCECKWDHEPLKQRNVRGDVRVCQVLSDCPTRYNAVVPLQPKVRSLTFRNIHRSREEVPFVHCSVYGPESVVLLRLKETSVRWFDFQGDVLGVSELVENRSFGDSKLKAVQGLFLTHERERAPGEYS